MFCVIYHNKQERRYFILFSLQRTALFSPTVPLFYLMFILPFFPFFLAVVSGLRWITQNLNPNSLEDHSQRNEKHGNLPEGWKQFPISLFVETRFIKFTVFYTTELPSGQQVKGGDKTPSGPHSRHTPQASWPPSRQRSAF